MEIGIIGLPRSGKTTIFNALTKGKAVVSGYSEKPNLGVTKVPDSRLDALAVMYKPRRVVSAEVTYTDVPPPPEGFGQTKGIGGEYLNTLQSADALLVVVRGFEDPSVALFQETVEPLRDAENMLMEMTFSDLDILDRRLAKIQEGFKGTRTQERELLGREQTLLARIKEQLDNGVALRDQLLSPDETRLISGFGFLSMKPLIVIANIGEPHVGQTEEYERELADVITGDHVLKVAMCAKLEMELAQMDSEEEQEFREDLGLVESGLNRMIRLSYEVVEQISFFTVGEDEVRAWEVHRNTVAQKAAGKIHSDLERGFIRAEVVSYEDLVHCGGLNEARKRGVLRQEGKDYVVEDGDIMHVLFNV